MGRRYTSEDYLELVQKLRRNIPNLSLTTDIIVGFPTEDEEDFNKTLEIVKQVKYDLAYTFIFSKRVGTPAYKLNDETPLDIKKQRLYMLNQIINKDALDINKTYIGKRVKVLIENISEKDNNCLMGYTETNKLVNVKGPKNIMGKIVDVEITDCKTWSLDGKYVN